MMSRTLYDVVLEGAARYPCRKAIVYDDGSTKYSLSYTELLDIANQLKTILVQHVRRGETVGLCLDDDNTLVTMPAVLLGVLQTGASFYNMAEDSLEFSYSIILDVQANVIIVHKQAFKKLQEIICVSDLQSSRVLPHPLEHLVLVVLRRDERSHNDLDLAYCITTSGTTGTPKIVKVPHRCIVPNIVHLRSIFDLSCEDVTFVASPLTFDPSIVEMFTTLSVGACLLLVPARLKMTPRPLLDTIWRRNKVTCIQATPTMLRRFNPMELSRTLFGKSESVRVMALGGEQFPGGLELSGMRSAGNQTKFYNLYGTTEVSCWATCHKVTEDQLRLECHVVDFIYCITPGDSTYRMCDDIPLGEPLDGTTIQVIDRADVVVTSGQGFLFIGGTDRQCILDHEEGATYDPDCLKMRATGDLVYVSEDKIVYLGREDAQVKINGRRVNMEEITKSTRSHVRVVNCAALVISSQIVVFIVLQPHEQESDNLRDLREYLIDKLPRHSQPDHIIPIQEIPMTKHGKLDERLLEKTFKTRKLTPSHSYMDFLDNMWKDAVGNKSTILDDNNFIQDGGNSLQAVHLVNALEDMTHMEFPELTDILLHKTYSEVKLYVTQCLCQGQSIVKKMKILNENDFPVDLDDKKTLTKSEKQTSDYFEGENINKIILKRASKTNLSDMNFEDGKSCYSEELLMSVEKRNIFDWSISRGNRVTPMSSEIIPAAIYSGTLLDGWMGVKMAVEVTVASKADICGIHLENNATVTVPSVSMASPSVSTVSPCVFMKQPSLSPALTLKETWRYNTGKCVDASPLLAVSSVGGGIVYIGSHSHKFTALCMKTGNVKWEITLPDRVESSACLSLCGNYVVVGCYDGDIYVLLANTGDLWWKIQTGSEVKSSPLVDLITGHVYVGSHSRKLYALNIQERREVWSKDIGCGSIFSSPVIGYSPHAVYVATLGGAVVAMDTTSGSVRWRYMCPKPVFGSPAILPQGLCVSCTDGNLYLLDYHGNLLWTFPTSGPIFSSPCFTNRTIPVQFSDPLSWTAQLMSSSTVCTHEGSLSTHIVDKKSHENEDMTTNDGTVPEGDTYMIYSQGDNICVGSHDGGVYCVSQQGTLLWRTKLDSPVYATPFQAVLVHRNQQVNTEDTRVHGTCNTCSCTIYKDMSANDDEKLQSDSDTDTHLVKDGTAPSTLDRVMVTSSPHSKSDQDGRVSTPARKDLDTSSLSLPIVIAASTRGVLYILHSGTGSVLGTKQLPGEVFSSPVMFGDTLYVGCRDDFVYCFTITVT